MKHTVEELSQMGDRQIAELTAQLRKGRFSELLIRGSDAGDERCRRVISVTFDRSDGEEMIVGPAPHWSKQRAWNPAADIAQAYGLLVWITETHGWAGWINFTSPPSIELWKSGTGSVAVPLNNARAMCYAFVTSMQKVINGQSN